MWSKIYTECSNCYKNNEHNNTCNQDMQCALPVITIMALWQLMNLGTWCTVTQCWYSRTKDCSNYYKSNEHNIIGGNVIQDIHRVLELLQEHEHNNTCNHDYPMCPPGYHHNGFMATHELGHKMYGYTMLVFKNQRVLKLATRAMSLILLGEMWFKIYSECSNCYKNNEHNNTCNQDMQCALPVITIMALSNGNSWTWAHDVRLHNVGIQEPKSAQITTDEQYSIILPWGKCDSTLWYHKECSNGYGQNNEHNANTWA